jgi:DNA polymerase-4
VLHLDLDSFFVSVERLRDSRLNGKPLIIGGSSDRGVVSSCSYEARAFGVHSAMPMRTARRLCPDAIVISGDMEEYSKQSKVVTQIIDDRAPLFEKSSIDEFYLDLTGMDRFFGSYKWSGELRQTIMRESGLPISFGLSVNKMVAKVATGEAKPNGQKEVPRGIEREFLAPMPVSKIPLIGKKTGQTLRNMGIERVRTLSEMPIEMLERLFGKMGIEMWRRANAIDESPVEPYTEAKSISQERTFQQDTIDVKYLKNVLSAMTEKLGYKLRSSEKLTSCVTVKIRYSNFDTVSRQMHIPYTSCDHQLIPRVIELFDKLYDRRLLIRLVGVRLSGLVNGNYQISLFEDSEERIRLYQAMDKIRDKHGQGLITSAKSQGLISRKKDINPFGKE